MQRWDIFCRILDNYGDIGVCWRLARQLAQEHKLVVRLWVDDLEVAKRLIGGLDAGLENQTIAGVEICHWLEPFKDLPVADVVIEAFACELPASYLTAMATSQKPLPLGPTQISPHPAKGRAREGVGGSEEVSESVTPIPTFPLQRGRSKSQVWLNLEYLSAEQWVAESHLLPSPHPTLPLVKHFFFPGFTAQSGGLIREQGLIEKRDAFQHDSQAQTTFWKKLGLTDSPSLKVSLFCYPHAPLADLLEAIASGTRTTTVFVSDSNTLTAIGDQLGLGRLMVGDNISKGNLTLQALPFLSQDDYDHLLWACDINFVRGEDSWVRALWAAKSFVWQPYWQEQDVHLNKLQAFLEFYSDGLPASAAEALRQAHINWSSNQFESHQFGSYQFEKTSWQALLDNLPTLQNHATLQSR
ncbi:MAG TPA: elongation factor P maturation arginine rhamnosyltransferase EarP, partial [Methylophilaceae bacterium]|nr:elongation factor P maturation arginine rhamnosyltransferase EarP [Methylophilaceae bacterium]